jgi:hypothetical protein
MRNALLGLAAACCAMAQTKTPLPIDDNVGFLITEKTTPPSGTNSVSDIVTRSPNGGPIHRVFKDASGRIVFAYDIQVNSASANMYEIVAKAGMPEYVRKLQTDFVPTLSSPQTVRCAVGDSVTLDLFSNAATGQTISDVFTLVRRDAPEVKTTVIRSVKLEDFQGISMDEAAGRLKDLGIRVSVEQTYNPEQVELARRALEQLLEQKGFHGQEVNAAVRQLPPRLVEVTFSAIGPMMRFDSTQVWENGTRLNAPPFGGRVTARDVGIYVKGHGGFFFAESRPKGHPEFQKAGWIDGNRLKFKWGNESYEIVSAISILPEGAKSDVWVFRDPNAVQKKDIGDFAVYTGPWSELLGKEEEEER